MIKNILEVIKTEYISKERGTIRVDIVFKLNGEIIDKINLSEGEPEDMIFGRNLPFLIEIINVLELVSDLIKNEKNLEIITKEIEIKDE